MPFYTYAVDADGDQQRYNDRRSVVLAGGGLIRSAWHQFQASKDGTWWVSAQQMLQAGSIDISRSIVIDTAPSRSGVSLFEIKYVLGYADGWAPLCLIMEQLFVDEDVGPDPQIFKENFLDGNCERTIVRTILYLKTDGNWGGNSRTTAALLWPETWDFFREWQMP